MNAIKKNTLEVATFSPPLRSLLLHTTETEQRTEPCSATSQGAMQKDGQALETQVLTSTNHNVLMRARISRPDIFIRLFFIHKNFVIQGS